MTKLRTTTTYYARVTGDQGTLTKPSAVYRVRTTSSTPGRVVATAAPAGLEEVVVTWARPARGTSVPVTITPTAAELADAGVRCTVSAIPATRTSAVITVPQRLRARIGTPSGNPVYVRVTVHNGDAVRTVAGTVSATAGALPVRGTLAERTTVATYNVAQPSMTSAVPGRAWADRRDAVARAITWASPDVVALQEVVTSAVENGARHYEDLAALLAPHGYAWATTSEQIGSSNGASKGAHIAYRTSTTTLLDSGLVSLREQAAIYAPGLPWVDDAGNEDPDRYATWALLRDKDSGIEFYAVSLHLKYGASIATEYLRDASAYAIDGFVRDLAATQGRWGAPVVLMGDLNSDNARYPDGPQAWFVEQGYVSAASAPTRDGLQVGSVNTRELDLNAGFPAAPYTSPHAGTRIDHIFVRNGGGTASYRNQIVLTPEGLFDEAYRGSDHHLQLAEISLRGW